LAYSNYLIGMMLMAEIVRYGQRLIFLFSSDLFLLLSIY